MIFGHYPHYLCSSIPTVARGEQGSSKLLWGDRIPRGGGEANNLAEPPAPGSIAAKTATNVVELFGRRSI
jgi:hypothetical protein